MAVIKHNAEARLNRIAYEFLKEHLGTYTQGTLGYIHSANDLLDFEYDMDMANAFYTISRRRIK